jgi:hypothetical protein
MNLQGIAAALQRVEAVVRRRPDVGLHEDAVPVSLNVQVDPGGA